MTRVCKLVLVLALDMPFLGHAFAVLPHGKTGAHFPVGGRYRFEFTRAESLQGTQTLLRRPGLAQIDHAMGKFVTKNDGRI